MFCLIMLMHCSNGNFLEEQCELDQSHRTHLEINAMQREERVTIGAHRSAERIQNHKDELASKQETHDDTKHMYHVYHNTRLNVLRKIS